MSTETFVLAVFYGVVYESASQTITGLMPDVTVNGKTVLLSSKSIGRARWLVLLAMHLLTQKPRYVVAANLDCTFWRRFWLYIVRDIFGAIYNPARQRW